jgi:hypothetical protein
MTNSERDELVASLRDWFKIDGLAGGEAIGIMLLTIAAITREYDDPEKLLNAAIRGLQVAGSKTLEDASPIDFSALKRMFWADGCGSERAHGATDAAAATEWSLL